MNNLRKLIENVYCELGVGHSEIIYHKAMEIGLGVSSVMYETKKVIPVTYLGYQVGTREMDLVVVVDGEHWILELKAVTKLNDNHRNQLKSYLRINPDCKGLLVNFGDKLEVEEVSI
jgi:GxxExxY protein